MPEVMEVCQPVFRMHLGPELRITPRRARGEGIPGDTDGGQEGCPWDDSKKSTVCVAMIVKATGVPMG